MNNPYHLCIHSPGSRPLRNPGESSTTPGDRPDIGNRQLYRQQLLFLVCVFSGAPRYSFRDFHSHDANVILTPRLLHIHLLPRVNVSASSPLKLSPLFSSFFDPMQLGITTTPVLRLALPWDFPFDVIAAFPAHGKPR